MKQLIYIAIISFLMTSCATIFNSPTTVVTINTSEPSEIIHDQETIQTINNKANLIVLRQNQPLSLIVVTDSSENQISVAQRNSGAFYLNWISPYFIGFIVDWNKPQRWAYPSKIWIDADEKNGYSRTGPAEKRDGLFHFSIPFANGLVINPDSRGVRYNTSFGGITLGFDYFHKKDQFIHVGYSIVNGGNFDRKVKDWQGRDMKIEESINSEYLSFSNNHRIYPFSIGYGLSFAVNRWNYHSFRMFLDKQFTVERRKERYSAFGFVFPAYIQFGEYFNLGLVYRPTFFRPSFTTDRFVYEHLISLDFAWKIGR
jgi:hypothetical protein